MRDYESVEQRGFDTVLTGVRHFDLAQTLDCGQAFRWSACENGYSGIAHGRRLEVFFDGDALILKNCSVEEFDSIWKDYFDLGRDYKELRTQLGYEEHIKNALAFSPGIRLMRQDAWETLVSFILSQHTNIPRIKKMITLLCEAFGEALPCGGFAFPAPGRIAGLEEVDFAPIKSGYRAKYIIDAAKQVASGRVDIPALSSCSTQYVRQALMGICGVGPKVADCVLLYGFGRAECYPVDVWIKRAMDKFYPQGIPDWGGQAGIAQLFLFHYIRNN